LRYKNYLRKCLKKYFFGLFFVILLLFVIATSNKKNTVVTSNINSVKSIESSRMLYTELEEIEEEEVEYVKVFSVDEIINNSGKLLEFEGTITGYGPDCPGCSGIVACYPNPNVLNNNIYYQDETYGTIRIVAADRSIPCGSIVRISNLFDEDVIGIVLDRGRDIHGMTMDLLFNSENTVKDFGRKYNINFKIERWGY